MPRITITLTEDMKKYFEKISKETGVSQSALVVLELSKSLKDKIKKE